MQKTLLSQWEIFSVFFNEWTVISVVFVNSVNKDLLLPCLGWLHCEFIIIQKISGWKSLGLDPAMITRDNLAKCIVFLLITGNTTVNTLLNDWNFIFIGTWNFTVWTSWLNAHRCILNLRIILKVSHIHFPQIQRALFKIY